MFDIIKNIASGLADYAKPVVPNFKPKPTIVPESVYSGSRQWKGIVLHHSATIDGKTNEWDGIRKYHTSYRIDGEIVDATTFGQRQMLGHGKTFEKPWSDIGYHGGWELEGDLYVFKPGRLWSVAGAHAGLKNNNTYNSDFLGLCIVGNYDAAAPAKELWELCLATVREIKQHFSFGADKVIGHREVYKLAGVPVQKSCPGNSFDLDMFRSQL